MAAESDVVEALRPVIDPELGRSIVEIGMVQAISIRRKSVEVEVALPAAEYLPKEALAAGITEALSGLASVDDISIKFDVMDEDEQRALANLLSPPDEKGARPNPFTHARTRVLAISSGKGGVGKSSVTTNLAIALAQAGYSVAAVDADVWGFSIPRMLGVNRPPLVVDQLIIPPAMHGVKAISMGYFAREDQPVIWRGPMLHKALEQFLTDVHWGAPDFLVIDMPPGTGDISLSMAQFLPRAEVIVVTTPQVAAQKVAQRAAYMAQKVNLTVVGVIENMSWFRGDDGKVYEIFGAGGGADLAKALDVPLLGQVPLVTSLREGSDVGRPIVVTEPDHEASVSFREIARRISQEIAPRRIYRSELKLM